MDSSDSELSDSDIELQNAFSEGRLKPGLNIPKGEPKQFINNPDGLSQKLSEFRKKLPWIECLDSINEQAQLAPELAAKMLINEEKRRNQLENNKKLPQYEPSQDPVLNDLKREMSFHRQAQSAVLDCLPKLKKLNTPLIRPDDYFAEMAKSDEQMHKIRENLQKQEEQQKRTERIREIRLQRKLGKQLQIQTKLESQKEKKKMLQQIKDVRKRKSNDLNFLEKTGKNNKKLNERRQTRDKKFGFGGRKKGLKTNTRDSAADISEYRKPNKNNNQKKSRKSAGNKRLGKNRRIKNKAKKH